MLIAVEAASKAMIGVLVSETLTKSLKVTKDEVITNDMKVSWGVGAKNDCITSETKGTESRIGAIRVKAEVM